MLEQHPDRLVAVPTDAGPRMQRLTALLPDTYFFPDADAPRVFRLNKRYREAVEAGRKTSSVRWDESWSVGPVTIYFEDDDGSPLSGVITTINDYRLNELMREGLRLEPTASVDEYVAGLRSHYPSMPADAVVQVVDFAIG